MRVLCNIDRTIYKMKPKDAWAIQNRLAKTEEIEVGTFFNLICAGCSFRAAAIDGTHDYGFISQQVFWVDIDNANNKKPIPEKERLTPEQAIRKAEEAGLIPNFCYKTFSDSEALRKFRISFIFNVPVSDINLRDRIAEYITSIFGNAADSACTNPARIFYGTNKPAILINTDDINCLDDFVKLLPEPEEPDKPRKPKGEPVKKMKPRNYASRNEPGRVSNVSLIKARKWGELAKRFDREQTIFDSVAEFKEYVWMLDIAELLEVPDGTKKFNCIFHDDSDPSAGIYFGDCGKWMYKCFAEDNCKLGGKALTIHTVISELANLKFWETWEAIKIIYNLHIEQTPESERLKGEILEISEIMDSLDETGFTARCPVSSKNIRYARELYQHILRIAIRNINPYSIDGKLVFFFSLSQLAKESGRSPNNLNKINQYVTMLAYHGLIEKLPDEQVPPHLLKRAYKYAGTKKLRIQFYALSGWDNSTLIDIETNGNRWKQNGYRRNGISYEAFYRTEGKDIADKLYPIDRIKDNGEIADKKPTKNADSRHDLITLSCLGLIEKKGYATEKEIAKELSKILGKEMTDRQIKRSIKDICECNNLIRGRCTKMLKEKYKIVSAGYPIIIYKED